MRGLLFCESKETPQLQVLAFQLRGIGNFSYYSLIIEEFREMSIKKSPCAFLRPIL